MPCCSAKGRGKQGNKTAPEHDTVMASLNLRVNRLRKISVFPDGEEVRISEEKERNL